MAQEHQEYIQTKVNPTLENLVTQVLLSQPENPVPFMVKFLADQTKNGKSSLAQFSVGEAERLRNEISALQAEVRMLEAKLGKASRSADQAEAADAEDEEDEEDDVVDDLPPPAPSYLKKGPRASVSAEVFGEWNKVQAFTPPVVPKTEEQKKRLQGVLQQSFLFSSLDTQNMNIIIDAMMEKKVSADKRVIQEGEDGAHMFVVEEGFFDCLKMIDEEEKTVKTCTTGDFFGELALLYNCPRAASVVASGPGVLWQLDRGTFLHIVRDASVHKRERHEDFLANVPLLAKLGKYERSQIADALQSATAEPGTVIITQGEEGNRFYLVEDGELVVTKAEGGTIKEVMTCKRGDHFGELALLEGDVRAATVTAKTVCTLLYLERKVFERLLGNLKEFMKEKAATAYR